MAHFSFTGKSVAAKGKALSDSTSSRSTISTKEMEGIVERAER